MNGSWLRGSAWDRLALHWQKADRRIPEPIDIFQVLRGAGKILILPNDRVGGLFLGAPVYKVVRRFYPRAHIKLLVDARRATLAQQIPFVDEVLPVPLDKSIWSADYRELKNRLVRESSDLAFCLGTDCSFRLAYLCLHCGARLRIGFKREEFAPFNIEIVSREQGRFEGDQCLQMLRLLGMEGDGEVRWALVEEKAQQIRSRYLDADSTGNRVVGIDLGTGEGKGLSKRQLDDIIGRIIERGARALLFFSLAERKQVNYLKETYGNRIIPFEQEDLASVAALLQGCQALIACNTDLLHLAISLEVPVVGLFDEEPERWLIADDERVRVVRDTDLRAMSITQVVQALDGALRRVDR